MTDRTPTERAIAAREKESRRKAHERGIGKVARGEFDMDEFIDDETGKPAKKPAAKK